MASSPSSSGARGTRYRTSSTEDRGNGPMQQAPGHEPRHRLQASLAAAEGSLQQAPGTSQCIVQLRGRRQLWPASVRAGTSPKPSRAERGEGSIRQRLVYRSGGRQRRASSTPRPCGHTCRGQRKSSTRHGLRPSNLHGGRHGLRPSTRQRLVHRSGGRQRRASRTPRPCGHTCRGQRKQHQAWPQAQQPPRRQAQPPAQQPSESPSLRRRSVGLRHHGGRARAHVPASVGVRLKPPSEARPGNKPDGSGGSPRR